MHALFQALPDIVIAEDIVVVEDGALLLQHAHDCATKPAAWRLGRALHEQHHLGAAYQRSETVGSVARDCE